MPFLITLLILIAIVTLWYVVPRIYNLEGRIKPYTEPVIIPTQISETHWNAKQHILTVYFKPIPGNPHYHDYHYRDGIWRKGPSMKLVEESIAVELTTILMNIHKGRGGSKSYRF